MCLYFVVFSNQKRIIIQNSDLKKKFFVDITIFLQKKYTTWEDSKQPAAAAAKQVKSSLVYLTRWVDFTLIGRVLPCLVGFIIAKLEDTGPYQAILSK